MEFFAKKILPVLAIVVIVAVAVVLLIKKTRETGE